MDGRLGCAVFLALLGCIQALEKDKLAMLRAHSAECLEESGAGPNQVEDLFNGDFKENAALKKHVLCVLMKCKMIGKEGKLLKSALLSKHLVTEATGAKVVEKCGNQANGDNPEDIAWEFFKCIMEKPEKKMLFGDLFKSNGSGEVHKAAVKSDGDNARNDMGKTEKPDNDRDAKEKKEA